MKKFFLFLLSAAVVLSCSDDPLVESSVVRSPEHSDATTSEAAWVKGRMRIKLKQEPTVKIAVRSAVGKVTTGLRSLDAFATELGIRRMERTFPYHARFEERARREGLHLWYDVWFSEEMPSTRAVTELSPVDEIEIASPVRKIVSTAAPSFSLSALQTALSAENYSTPFNDPSLPKQWSYQNPGIESWQQKGSDIRLFDVWRQYNGHPGIIVAIMDGGIALDNPDLQANLWTNRNETVDNETDDDDNGYADDVHGYNFVSMRSGITPHRHGTHVAGTIAATTHNAKGIAGIAGGNGTASSGVKLMSCQIFEHPATNYYSDIISTNIPAAIKYAADNGAVISQNSWGYAADSPSSPSYLDPADKAAIDYFVKYAGCDNEGRQLPESPLKGGIVFFASGNSNTSNPRIAAPADYEKVIGVAAIGPDYKKAPYSNYGDYMDICAPGGVENGPKGIYSTTIKELGYYEYRYGTSMSCPHVSAVAALVIEKFGTGKQGFTAAQLEEIILTTAYDVDAFNPQYAGKLGYGCVDATAALQDKISLPRPFTLQSNRLKEGTLSFRVTSELAGTALLTIINSTGNKVLRKSLQTVRYVSANVDIGKLAAGYYSLEYTCNGTTVKEKFIKY